MKARASGKSLGQDFVPNRRGTRSRECVQKEHIENGGSISICWAFTIQLCLLSMLWYNGLQLSYSLNGTILARRKVNKDPNCLSTEENNHNGCAWRASSNVWVDSHHRRGRKVATLQSTHFIVLHFAAPRWYNARLQRYFGPKIRVKSTGAIYSDWSIPICISMLAHVFISTEQKWNKSFLCRKRNQSNCRRLQIQSRVLSRTNGALGRERPYLQKELTLNSTRHAQTAKTSDINDIWLHPRLDSKMI